MSGLTRPACSLNLLTPNDISITAAGICPDQPFLERSPESVKRCFEINSLGTYYSTQLAVAQMVKQPRLEGSKSAGSVVMIASIAAHQASKDQFTSDYCSSKGAVLSLSRQLSVELAAHQVRVNCVSPGYVFLVPPPHSHLECIN